jgi:hypothetical protein
VFIPKNNDGLVFREPRFDERHAVTYRTRVARIRMKHDLRPVLGGLAVIAEGSQKLKFDRPLTVALQDPTEQRGFGGGANTNARRVLKLKFQSASIDNMAAKTIFVLLPLREEFDDVFDVISDAARVAGQRLQQQITVARRDRFVDPTSITSQVRDALAAADLVVADISAENFNIAFEVGMTAELKKPIILISHNLFVSHNPSRILFFARQHPIVIYDRQKLVTSLVPQLRREITTVLRYPDDYAWRTTREEPRTLPYVFMSYSHVDALALQRLQVHLRPLHKKGVIEPWADTSIKAGDKWKERIEDALDRAVIAVLLISADFLASDFIIDNELPPLLRGAEEKGTRILPVILKPCRFESDENLSQFQALNPPSEPVLSMPPIEQERVWDEVAQAIEVEIASSAV